MKIGIDIDEVVVKYVDGYLKVFQEEYGRAVSFEDVFSSNFGEVLRISKEEDEKLHKVFGESMDFDDIELIEGAKEAVINLSKAHEVTFITFRPLRLKEKTKFFLEKIFPDNSFNVFYAKEFPNGSKAKVCKSLGINLMIEDHAPAAFECADNGIKVFLMDKPWNRNYNHNPNITRVKNWQEILSQLQ
jgi:uncharacterized HAD superfamily protein